MRRRRTLAALLACASLHALAAAPEAVTPAADPVAACRLAAHGYGDLFWRYVVLNRKPHSNWDPAAEIGAAAATD